MAMPSASSSAELATRSPDAHAARRELDGEVVPAVPREREDQAATPREALHGDHAANVRCLHDRAAHLWMGLPVRSADPARAARCSLGHHAPTVLRLRHTNEGKAMKPKKRQFSSSAEHFPRPAREVRRCACQGECGRAHRGRSCRVPDGSAVRYEVNGGGWGWAASGLPLDQRTRADARALKRGYGPAYSAVVTADQLDDVDRCERCSVLGMTMGA